MSKFKVGDKLRCINPDPDWCGSKYGTVWTFSGYYNGDEKFVQFEESSSSHGFYANDYASNWEIYNKNPLPELTTGMRVKHRNGQVYLVVKETEKLYNMDGFNNFSSFNLENGKDKWTRENEAGEWDIVKVYKGFINANFLNLEEEGDLIWQADDNLKEIERIKNKITVNSEQIESLIEQQNILQTKLEELER